jgi:hypothetical protein
VSCRDFEKGLDRLMLEAGRPGDLGALESHAAGCPSCAGLLELARLPSISEGSPGVAEAVLARTSGPACRQAEKRLGDWVDGLVPQGTESGVLAQHLEHCPDCAGLVAELERLAVELPRLAIVAPEPSLVAGVLRRTLPFEVRLRRWWAEAGSQWVRRPRFASELAYVATLVLVLLFGTPVSPLQAMPARAVALARSVPLDRLETLPRSAGEEVAYSWESVTTRAAGGVERAEGVMAAARATAGTILDEVASWFVTADDNEPAAATETTEETS